MLVSWRLVVVLATAMVVLLKNSGTHTDGASSASSWRAHFHGGRTTLRLFGIARALSGAFDFDVFGLLNMKITGTLENFTETGISPFCK
jgi:hypothetical protein